MHSSCWVRTEEAKGDQEASVQGTSFSLQRSPGTQGHDKMVKKVEMTIGLLASASPHPASWRLPQGSLGQSAATSLSLSQARLYSIKAFFRTVLHFRSFQASASYIGSQAPGDEDGP